MLSLCNQNNARCTFTYWTNLIRRTKAGQETARARGRMGGQPKGFSPHYQEISPMVVSAYKQERSIRDIMKAFKIPSTANFECGRHSAKQGKKC